MLVRPKPLDISVAMVAFALGVVEAVRMLASIGSTASVPRLLPVAVCCLPLAWRRGPLPVAPFALLAAVLTDRALEGTWTGFSLPYALLASVAIAIFSLAAHARLAIAAIGAAVAIAALELAMEARLGSIGAAEILNDVVLGALIVVGGRLVGGLRGRTRVLAELSAVLDRERLLAAEVAVAIERSRIARDVHDAVAHAVATMVVQAGGAETVLTREPNRTRDALDRVQHEGREAVDQLRRSLEILRTLPPPAMAGEPESIERPARRGSAIAGLLTVLALLASVKLQASQLEHGPSWLLTGLTAEIGVALYVLGARVAWPMAVLAATAAGVIFTDAGLGGGDSTVGRALTTAMLFSLPLGIGIAARLQREHAERRRLLNTRLERERDARARLAAADERGRLARELHDAVAHGISVMVLQAGAAERVLERTPDQAHAAILAIQRTGRVVIDELRTLLGMLRVEGDEPLLRSRPTLSEVEPLLARFRAAGLSVDLRVIGDPVEPPASVDASAYRIIQEALTNALKHAGPASAWVTVAYETQQLRVEIINEAGTARTGDGSGGGHGVIGMRERAALHDGELDAAPDGDGGYAVRVRLPLPVAQ